MEPVVGSTPWGPGKHGCDRRELLTSWPSGDPELGVPDGVPHRAGRLPRASPLRLTTRPGQGEGRTCDYCAQNKDLRPHKPAYYDRAPPADAPLRSPVVESALGAEAQIEVPQETT
ncbi:hypothetical protein NDU88_004244 [Pleurodeles waltl]|uniref:Uncharacterized protein n=1 Tax=Pleurodeles waltl TaxID=8319 RepID=A0AAV7WU17_PLEWA|nr:hypothetical protein NDU88_004244 [Pleurodeles waltl]